MRESNGSIKLHYEGRNGRAVPASVVGVVLLGSLVGRSRGRGSASRRLHGRRAGVARSRAWGAVGMGVGLRGWSRYVPGASGAQGLGGFMGRALLGLEAGSRLGCGSSRRVTAGACCSHGWASWRAGCAGQSRGVRRARSRGARRPDATAAGAGLG
jgi:hypothetical protein